MKSGLLFLILASALQASALDSNGSGPTRGDAVALYVFRPEYIDQAAGLVKDLAPNPLDLKITVQRPGAIQVLGDSLELVEPNMLRSVTSADKIVSACKASNELTVEMWVENRTPAQKLANNENDVLPNNVFKQSLRLMSLADTYFKEYHNFGFFQAYNMGDTYKASTRTTSNSGNNLGGDWVDNLLLPKENFLLGKKQHIVFVRNAGGTAKLYYSDDNGNDSGPFVMARGFGGNFSNWHTSGTPVSFDTPDDGSGAVSRNLDIRLAIGNEASADQDFSKPVVGGESATKRSRHWPWVGKIYMAAVYCRALTETEILGTRASRQEIPKLFPIDVDRRITPSMTQAQNIYTRITGVKTSIDNPVIAQMADLIDANDSFKAAELATQDPNFYNITVRDMAARMSTRDELTSSPLSDFVATIIGATRDNLDARKLLTDNLNYVADVTKAAVPSSLERDIVRSNNHYLALQEGGFDLSKVLVKSTQKVFNGTQVVEPSETAGLLTSRAWMQAHAVAGTNRRLVEFTFKEFLCTPIEKWSDTTGSDAFIGRDIDRFPAGSHTKFTNNCRSCHTRMDPLRGAFAYFTFGNNMIKHSFVVDRIAADQREDAQGNENKMATGLQPGDPALTQLPSLGSVAFVTKKMNHNQNVFPGGRVITDNSFENSALDPWGQAYFGWRGPTKGKGVKEFGAMVANSEQFSRCMARRVFASVCKREPQSFDDKVIKESAKEFADANNGYKLDYLFKKIVTTPNCLGELK